MRKGSAGLVDWHCGERAYIACNPITALTTSLVKSRSPLIMGKCLVCSFTELAAGSGLGSRNSCITCSGAHLGRRVPDPRSPNLKPLTLKHVNWQAKVTPTPEILTTDALKFTKLTQNSTAAACFSETSRIIFHIAL